MADPEFVPFEKSGRMITLGVIVGHLMFNGLLGQVLLSAWGKHTRNVGESWILALLLGIYAETLILGTLLFIGVSLFKVSWGLLACTPFLHNKSLLSEAIW